MLSCHPFSKPMPFDRPVACIDLETTGASPQFDRVTEIGIVEIDIDGSLREWSTLVNPQTRIPTFIEKLTGISNAMVADAPTFAEVAAELLARLHGRLLVAHNARFDHAFLRNELKRLDIAFHADTLCTVRLSRRLYPQHHKHNLDSLIQRLGIRAEERHRALADARVLAVFLQRLHQEHTSEAIDHAIRQVMARPALPPHLPEGLIDDIPDGPGIYLFYGDNDLPLYVGKSTRLRTRVLDHFSGDHASGRELRIAQQLQRIEWRETAGELGALLLEARLVKELQPMYNQRLRRGGDLCAWQPVDGPHGAKSLRLVHAADLDFGSTPNLHGLFDSPRKAEEALRALAGTHRLCLIQLGLEKPARGRRSPCFGRPLGKCAGLCAGKENPLRHDLRLLEALARIRLQAWPYEGAIGIRESRPGYEELHVFDRWAWLGTAHDEAEVSRILEARPAAFDPDTYRILAKHLRTHGDVVGLSSRPAIPDSPPR